jgi:hypothetical protein|tara:strand:+ start:7883 stop:8809 length:927 start_codon:yes stop_codon:yes gene_type:complete
MAISRRPLDVDNYSALDGGTGLAIPGYYRRTNLNDIINNFIVAYIGDGKVLTEVPRYEVAFWAQRAVQEFSYDTFHSEKALEIQLSSTRQMSLPSDYVNYISVQWTDSNGVMRTILPSTTTRASKGVAQDDNYHYLYDQDGNIIFAETSETIDRYQNNQTPEEVADSANSYYYGWYDTPYFGYYGARYGLTPQFANINGTFVLDLNAGQIYFPSSFSQDTYITLNYISDGLGENGDFDNVLVPKMAEDAVMSTILYNLSKIRPSAAGAASLYKKEAAAKTRNAKIRIANMKIEEMTQIFRNKAKWIKH